LTYEEICVCIEIFVEQRANAWRQHPMISELFNGMITGGITNAMFNREKSKMIDDFKVYCREHPDEYAHLEDIKEVFSFLGQIENKLLEGRESETVKTMEDLGIRVKSVISLLVSAPWGSIMVHIPAEAMTPELKDKLDQASDLFLPTIREVLANYGIDIAQINNLSSEEAAIFERLFEGFDPEDDIDLG